MDIEQAHQFIVGRVLPMKQEIDQIIAEGTQPPAKYHKEWFWKIEHGGSHRHATLNKWVPFSRSLHVGSGMMMTVSRARKVYQCEWCQKAIEPGEEYARFRTVRDCDGIPAGMVVMRHMHCLTSGLQITTQWRDNGF